MASITEELGYLLGTIKKKIIPITTVALVGFILSFEFLDPILLKIKQDLLPKGATLIYISPVEVIMLKLKIALIIGILLASPLIGYYAYKTLKVRFEIQNPIKKSHLIILLSSGIILFLLGICYSYFLMLPIVLTYLYHISSVAEVVATYSIYDFFSFVIILTLILGVTFEVPIIIAMAVRSGLVQIATLKEYRRYIIVGIFCIAAIVTPPDVVSQLIVVFPLIISYEVGIQVASILFRRPSVQPRVYFLAFAVSAFCPRLYILWPDNNSYAGLLMQMLCFHLLLLKEAELNIPSI